MARNLSIETFDSVGSGVITDAAPYEIPDTAARMILDGIIRTPNILAMRGPITPSHLASYSTDVVYPDYTVPQLFMAGQDPLGQHRLGLVCTLSYAFPAFTNETNVYFLGRFSSTVTTVNLIKDQTILGIRPVLKYFNSSPSVAGGSILGASSTIDEPSVAYDDSVSEIQVLAMWRGGAYPSVSYTNTVFTQGSRTVTGAGFFNKVFPGMFMQGYINNETVNWTPVVGVVKRLVSDSQLELEEPALWSNTTRSPSFTIFSSFAGIEPRLTTGLITTTTTSANVIGANTKFKTQRINQTDPVTGYTSKFDIFRRSDLKYVGTVASVTNDETIALAANATVDMQDEEYVAINNHTYQIVDDLATSFSRTRVGYLVAHHAERQFYANRATPETADDKFTNRVWFSDVGDPQALDLSPDDGDFFNVNSEGGKNTPITALVPYKNGLLIFKEDEVFKMTGFSPSQFSVRSFFDDGVPNPQAVTTEGDLVIWAGKKGIWAYDGNSPINLLRGTNSSFYENTGLPLPADTKIAVYRNKVIASTRGTLPTQVIKGGTPVTVRGISYIVDLKTRAITFFSNLPLVTSIAVPWFPSESVYAINGRLAASTIFKAQVCSFNELFRDHGLRDPTIIQDSIHSITGVRGPTFYLETKKYAARQFLQKKRWKLLLLNYFSNGVLKVDLVPGYDTDVSAAQTLDFPSTGDYTWDDIGALYATWDLLGAAYATWTAIKNVTKIPRRSKFMKPNQLLSLRFYPELQTNKYVELRNWALGYRFYRPGRV